MSRLAVWASALVILWAFLAGTVDAEPQGLQQPSDAVTSTGSPMELSDEIRAWARRIAPPMAPPALRLRLLLRALIFAKDGFLEEVEGHTPTALEAFKTRRADCVAFALLFVALSREVDVPTYFVMTRAAERFDERGDLIVAVRHLAVGYGPSERPRLIDFGGKSRPEQGQVEAVSDETAIAIYHSNQGTQRLLSGQALDALPWFERAVELAPELRAARDNLAIARRRLGRVTPGETVASRPPRLSLP